MRHHFFIIKLGMSLYLSIRMGVSRTTPIREVSHSANMFKDVDAS